MSSTIESRSVELTEDWTKQAEEAIKITDTKKLRQLLDEACKHNALLAKGFDGFAAFYSTDKLKPPRADSDSAIAAMRDVALAAIELCKNREAQKP